MSIVSTESYVHTILLRPLTRFKMGWPDAYNQGAQAVEAAQALKNWRAKKDASRHDSQHLAFGEVVACGELR